MSNRLLRAGFGVGYVLVGLLGRGLMVGMRDVARCGAGTASLGAGLVHAAVIREHLVDAHRQTPDG